MLTKIEMPKPLFDSNKFATVIAAEWVKKIDDLIIKMMYEKYKDSEATQIILIDEWEFAHFLKAMLPKWKEMTHHGE